MAQCCMGYCGLLLTNAVLMRREPRFLLWRGLFPSRLCGYHSYLLQVEATNGKKFFRECSRRLFIARQSARRANRTTKPTQRYHA